MNINEVFDFAIQLEEKMSLCYQEVRNLCQDGPISEELIKMSAEEIAHKNLLITGKNYINATPNIYILKPTQTTDLKIGLKNIDSLIGKIQNNKIDLNTALTETIEIERSFAQYHLKTISEVKDMSLKRLFEILSLSDKDHEGRLLRIQAIFQHQSKITTLNSS